MIRHRPADIGVEIPSRRGAGQRHVVEGESPGPDSIGQVSQSIEGYPTVGSQLAFPWARHAAPRKPIRPARGGASREVGSGWPFPGDVLWLRGHAGGVTVVLLLGGAEHYPVLVGHGVEVLSIVKS